MQAVTDQLKEVQKFTATRFHINNQYYYKVLPLPKKGNIKK